MKKRAFKKTVKVKMANVRVELAEKTETAGKNSGFEAMEMAGLVEAFIAAKKAIFAKFGAGEDLPIRICTEIQWQLVPVDEMFLLRLHRKLPENFAVIRNEGSLCVFKHGRYSLVVGIDCVKTAFLLDNDSNIG